LWGTTKSYEGVRMGFSKGFLMNDDLNYLEKGDRKQIYYKDFTDIKNIDFYLLKVYIFEALLIDEEFKK